MNIATLALWPRSQMPQEWLPCDGRSIDPNNSTLASLFSYPSKLPKLGDKFGLKHMICVKGSYSPGKSGGKFGIDMDGTEPIGIVTPFTMTEIPAGWALCDGKSLNVSEFTMLFSIIGFTFGGGNPVFKLPNTGNEPHIICTSAGVYPTGVNPL